MPALPPPPPGESPSLERFTLAEDEPRTVRLRPAVDRLLHLVQRIYDQLAPQAVPAAHRDVEPAP